MTERYTFDAADKDPAETVVVELDLYELCANRWRPNEPVSLNEFVRPDRPTGYSYEATTAGVSGWRAPAWPTTLAATVQDGSITWTCRAASSNGVSVISSPSAVSDPTGLTISGVAVSESTKIVATYAGGTLGQDYDAVYTFTLDGVTRIARQTVRVRKL